MKVMAKRPCYVDNVLYRAGRIFEIPDTPLQEKIVDRATGEKKMLPQAFSVNGMEEVTEELLEKEADKEKAEPMAKPHLRKARNPGRPRKQADPDEGVI